MNSLNSGRAVYPAEEFTSEQSSTLCFTGHRSGGIRTYRGIQTYRSITVAAVRLMLSRYIDLAAESGYTTFISGLAEGIDLWAAEYVLKMRMTNPDIRLIGAMPYLRHAERFSASGRRLLEQVEEQADCLITVNTDPDSVYSRSGASEMKNLYRDRNYFMVESSSAVIAFLDENKPYSGTMQTVSYAYRRGRKVFRFGSDDIFDVIDEAGTDIRSIGAEILQAVPSLSDIL
ncbi:MAG: SLOG family protein [Ruminococcus sp.]